MDMRRFGRKLKLPSTIAIKHQIRRMMADDEVKKTQAEEKARAETAGIPPTDASLALHPSDRAPRQRI